MKPTIPAQYFIIPDKYADTLDNIEKFHTFLSQFATLGDIFTRQNPLTPIIQIRYWHDNIQKRPLRNPSSFLIVETITDRTIGTAWHTNSAFRLDTPERYAVHVAPDFQIWNTAS